MVAIRKSSQLFVKVLYYKENNFPSSSRGKNTAKNYKIGGIKFGYNQYKDENRNHS